MKEEEETILQLEKGQDGEKKVKEHTTRTTPDDGKVLEPNPFLYWAQPQHNRRHADMHGRESEHWAGSPQVFMSRLQLTARQLTVN